MGCRAGERKRNPPIGVSARERRVTLRSTQPYKREYSVELERLAGQVLGPFDRDQHRVALFFRVAVLFGLDQPLPDLVIDRPGLVDPGGAVEAGDAAPRQYPFFAQ